MIKINIRRRPHYLNSRFFRRHYYGGYIISVPIPFTDKPYMGRRYLQVEINVKVIR